MKRAGSAHLIPCEFQVRDEHLVVVSGQLSAQCMGPTKLAYCELYDLRDGTYTLSVKPSEIGKHTLGVFPSCNEKQYIIPYNQASC